MKLHEQLEAINNGTPAEEIARDDQDPAFLKRLAKQYKAKRAAGQSSPKRKPVKRTYHSKRRAPASHALRGSYHQQEDARLRAEADKVGRVNKLEKKPISVFVNGVLQIVIGG
jgi:hypothetical protein